MGAGSCARSSSLGPLSVVALIAGWVTTEVGRQPWVVYGHMRTEDAVTGAGGIPLGYAALVLIYVGARRRRRSGCCGGSARAPLVLEVGDGTR